MPESLPPTWPPPPTAAEMQAGLAQLRQTTTFPAAVYDEMQAHIDAVRAAEERAG